jgi:hypothetical protein
MHQKKICQLTNISTKLPENLLEDPSIINLMKQTCISLACIEVLKINDVVCRQDARSIIEIKYNPIMVEK